MNRRKGLGEVEVLMAVMMMECHTEQVVITVMMATVVGGGGGLVVMFASGSCKLDPVIKP